MTHIIIEDILQDLEASRVTGDSLGLQEAAGRLLDRVEDATLNELVGVADAAQQWGVSVSRARAHIAALHKRLGVGRQVGGSWVLLRRHVEGYPPPPDGRGRPRTGSDAEPTEERATSPAKRWRSVGLSPRAWAFLSLYALQLGVSEDEALERVVRSNVLFVSENRNEETKS